MAKGELSASAKLRIGQFLIRQQKAKWLSAVSAEPIFLTTDPIPEHHFQHYLLLAEINAMLMDVKSHVTIFIQSESLNSSVTRINTENRIWPWMAPHCIYRTIDTVCVHKARYQLQPRTILLIRQYGCISLSKHISSKNGFMKFLGVLLTNLLVLMLFKHPLRFFEPLCFWETGCHAFVNYLGYL